jgi:hypothetical protein
MLFVAIYFLSIVLASFFFGLQKVKPVVGRDPILDREVESTVDVYTNLSLVRQDWVPPPPCSGCKN